MTMSPPVRVFALLGILGATALAAFFFLVARPGAAEDTVPATPATKPAATATRPAAKPPVTTRKPAAPTRATPVRTQTGFPPAIDRALRRHAVVVIAVYMPGSSVDSVVVAEARGAARQARAGYVAISALNERLVRGLVAKTGILPEPAVLVVKRSGVVTSVLSVTDGETVAQAVALARR